MPAATICQCSSCATRFKVDASFAGRQVKCPRCAKAVGVPKAASETDTQSVSAAGTQGMAVPAAAKPASRPAIAKPLAGASKSAAVKPPAASPVAGPPVARPAPPRSAPPVAAPAAPPLAANSANAANPIAALHSMPAAPSVIVQTSPNTAYQRPPKKGLPVALLAAVGGTALLLLIGVAVLGFMFAGGGDEPVAGKSKKPNTPTTTGGATQLVLDWPESERRGAAVTIDGETRPVQASGDVKFSLAPGEHKVLIRRRGYEPIETNASLARGETERFKPEFKASSVAPIETVASTPASSGVSSSSSESTPFPIGIGVDDAPRGFTGFLQNFGEAKREAAKENKNILMVFGSSDSDRDTQQLAASLQTPEFKEFRSQHLIPLVIDFPRTREGYSLLQDSAQNQGLFEEYQIRSVPTVALVDAKGKPFYIERKWDNGYRLDVARVEEWLKSRQSRDELLAAAEAETDEAMTAATAAVKWIHDSHLWAWYENNLVGFHQKAQRIDPNNEKGMLEVFVEPLFYARNAKLDDDDHTGIDLLRHLLEPLTKNGCKDADRAVKMHMLMARCLANIERTDQASEHLAKAASYTPSDKDLAQAITMLKQALENKDVLSTGTGFLISEAGYLLTNHHVVEGEGKVMVRVPGQKENLPGTVLAKDARRDMALVKIDLPEDASLAPISLTTAQLGRGAPVAAFGYPLGDVLGKGLKLTTGVISSPPDGSADNMFLLDLRVNPGNSGGPLCDSRGNVVGMVTAKTSAFGVDSYGMALPADELLKFLDANLPYDASRPEAAESDEPLSWDRVDQKVSPAVLMIMKIKD
jgi:tetratricopeptide (TPR) repeat protein